MKTKKIKRYAPELRRSFDSANARTLAAMRVAPDGEYVRLADVYEAVHDLYKPVAMKIFDAAGHDRDEAKADVLAEVLFMLDADVPAEGDE